MTSTGGIVEWLGYAASALVLISLTMSSIARLRWFSLAGASCFLVYSGLIGAFPIMVVNSGILAINVYYLARMHLRKDYFKILQVDADSSYLADFLDYYKHDIRKWYPDFKGSLDEEHLVLFTLRNMAVAGVFAGKPTDKATLCVELDFAVPQYADRKVGRHLYRTNRDYFLSRGFRKFTVELARIRNRHYFRAMGFQRLHAADSHLLML